MIRFSSRFLAVTLGAWAVSSSSWALEPGKYLCVPDANRDAVFRVDVAPPQGALDVLDGVEFRLTGHQPTVLADGKIREFGIYEIVADLYGKVGAETRPGLRPMTLDLRVGSGGYARVSGGELKRGRAAILDVAAAKTSFELDFYAPLVSDFEQKPFAPLSAVEFGGWSRFKVLRSVCGIE